MIATSALVISDAAKASSFTFLLFAVVSFAFYTFAWMHNWNEVSMWCFFCACLLSLAMVFFLLLCPWFKEPAGGWIVEKTTTLSHLIQPNLHL